MKKAIRHFIITRAREIFLEKGYSCTTMEDIATIAEISKPTLYHYFSGKEDIFRQVLELSNRELEHLLDPVLKGSDDFPQKLKKIAFTILNHVNKNRGMLKIAFHETHMFIDAIDQDQKGSIHEFLKTKFQNVTKLKEFFLYGSSKGLIRKDIPAELMAVFFSGIMSEVSLAYILGMSGNAEPDIENLTGIVTDLLCRGIMRV